MRDRNVGVSLRPHGRSCSFALHEPSGERLVGFSNQCACVPCLHVVAPVADVPAPVRPHAAAGIVPEVDRDVDQDQAVPDERIRGRGRLPRAGRDRREARGGVARLSPDGVLVRSGHHPNLTGEAGSARRRSADSSGAGAVPPVRGVGDCLVGLLNSMCRRVRRYQSPLTPSNARLSFSNRPG